MLQFFCFEQNKSSNDDQNSNEHQVHTETGFWILNVRSGSSCLPRGNKIKANIFIEVSIAETKSSTAQTQRQQKKHSRIQGFFSPSFTCFVYLVMEPKGKMKPEIEKRFENFCSFFFLWKTRNKNKLFFLKLALHFKCSKGPEGKRIWISFWVHANMMPEKEGTNWFSSDLLFWNCSVFFRKRVFLTNVVVLGLNF